MRAAMRPPLPGSETLQRLTSSDDLSDVDDNWGLEGGHEGDNEATLAGK